MTKRVSIAVVLPSGVESGGFSSRVVKGGEFLEVIGQWPTPVSQSGAVASEMAHIKK